MRVVLFIEYQDMLIVQVIVRVIIQLHNCVGWHISSKITRFARAITAIIKLAPLEL